jgi:hypothetical protein
VIRFDEGQIRGHLDRLVRDSVEEILNALLEAEDGARHRSSSRGSVRRAVTRCMPADPAGATHRRNSAAQPTVA